MDWILNEDQRLVRDMVREFVAAEVTPEAAEWDREKSFPEDVFRQLGELGLFGMTAIGPNMLVTLGLLCVVMTLDPRVGFMPLAANALWFTEARGIKPGKMSWLLGASVLLALVLGVTCTIWLQYRHAHVSSPPRARKRLRSIGSKRTLSPTDTGIQGCVPESNMGTGQRPIRFQPPGESDG